MSGWDRVLRIVLGVAMLLAGWTEAVPRVWSIALSVFGWFPLTTGLVGWCPVYSLLGTSSLNRKPPPR